LKKIQIPLVEDAIDNCAEIQKDIEGYLILFTKEFNSYFEKFSILIKRSQQGEELNR